MNSEISDYWVLFAEEARDAFETAEMCVLALEDGESSEELHRLYRAMHSLKGSSRTLGLASTESLAHRAEDVVSLVRDHSVDASPEWFDLVLRSLDVLQAMVQEAVDAREDRPNELAMRLIDDLDRFYVEFDPEQGEEPPAPVLPSQHPGDLFLFGDDGDIVTVEDYEPGRGATPVPVLEVDAPVFDAAAIVEEIATETGAQVEPPGPAPPAGRLSVAPRTGRLSRRPRRDPAEDRPRPAERFIRLPVGKVEHVMSLAGEINLAIGALLESAAVAGDHTRVHRAEMLIQELQHAAAGLGLTPVTGVLQRAKRLVRDLAQQTGKELNLIIEASETEIDRMLVDRIYDPIMHIIRNAADHGIETAEARVTAGKPRAGTIRLTAQQENGQILIRIEDDGRGIDVERVLARAIERGLVDADEELSTDKAQQLIMAPGFSTVDAVSNLSGRGVGLDVVASTVKELGGGVHVSSVRGEGTRFDLHLPLTLAFAEVIVVELEEQLFGVPISAVSTIFKPKREQVSTVSAQGEVFVRQLDDLVRVCWLEQVFAPGAAPPSVSKLTEKILVTIKTPAGRVSLPVDRILGSERITMKALPAAMDHLPYAAGCGVLRSGRILVALDCLHLVPSASSHLHSAA